MRQAHPARVRYKMALTISRLEWSRGRPPGATGAVLGNKGSSIAHWRSVRSVGYLRPCATHTSAAQPRGNREHRARRNALVTRDFENFSSPKCCRRQRATSSAAPMPAPGFQTRTKKCGAARSGGSRVVRPEPAVRDWSRLSCPLRFSYRYPRHGQRISNKTRRGREIPCSANRMHTQCQRAIWLFRLPAGERVTGTPSW